MTTIRLPVMLSAWAATVGLAFLAGGRSTAAEAVSAFRFDPSQNIMPAPPDPVQWPAFREALAKWRAETRTRLKYSDALYQRR